MGNFRSKYRVSWRTSSSNPEKSAFGGIAPSRVWLAGGISAANAIAIYYPVGAADLASSYINLANPGTYNAKPGSAPSWSAARGWYGASWNLQTNGLIPASGTWTFLVWYTAGTQDSYRSLFGCEDSGNSSAIGLQMAFALSPARIKALNGSATGASNYPIPTSDVFYAIAAKNVYKGALAEPYAIGAGTPTNTIPLMIGATTVNGTSATQVAGADIKALFIYDTALTQAQIEAVGIAIGAIDAVTTEDITYTSSVEA